MTFGWEWLGLLRRGSSRVETFKKAYDRVLMEVLWRCLGKKGVSIKDMYNSVKTSVRTVGEDIKHFSIEVGLYQGSALSLFLFEIVLDELIRNIQGVMSWCMLFTDDIILIDKTRVGLND